MNPHQVHIPQYLRVKVSCHASIRRFPYETSSTLLTAVDRMEHP